MKCADVRKWIPLHFQGRLTPEQLAEFEEHIAGCHDCREEAEFQRLVFEKSRQPGMLPERPDLVKPVLERIKAVPEKNRPMPANNRSRWLRPALIVVCAAILLVVAMVKPWNGGLSPEQLVAYASEPQLEIRSYRMDYVSEAAGENGPIISRIHALYVSPDRFYLRTSGDGWVRELIKIGVSEYRSESGTPVEAPERTAIVSMDYVPHKEETLRFLEYLVDVKELPDEKIDGVSYYKLEGRFPRIAWEDRLPQGDLTDEQYQQILDQISQDETSNRVFLWIDKDNYVIKQLGMEETDLQGDLVFRATITYSGFNEDFSIDAPLDENGGLLPGWR